MQQKDSILMNIHSSHLGQFSGKNVLLLQGPVGTFFDYVAKQLANAGAKSVTKINFNGGDRWFYSHTAIDYRGSDRAWPSFCENILEKRSVDAILLFGDCRPLHQTAIQVAKTLGVQVWVFEEGYARPNYVTLQKDGVNGFSDLTKDVDFYHQQTILPLPKDVPVGATLGAAAKQAMTYYIAAALAWPYFFRYKHHRSLSLLEGPLWVRSYWRKLYYHRKEAGIQENLCSKESGNFFLVILQASLDSQIRFHSHYASVGEFMQEVAQSFAANAPSDSILIFKHHPIDRGYTDYTADVQRLKDQYSLNGRLQYIHDQHLPTLLSHAKGVVAINSTVGLSALDHAAPVKVTGKAIYDMEGLTYQGSLNEFWGAAGNTWQPDLVLHAKFKNYVIAHTQINGNIYKPFPLVAAEPGLAGAMKESHG